MKRILLAFLVGLAIPVSAGAQGNPTPPSAAPTQTVETIVCIRHAEKPTGGLGQLTCQGLNRALALPDVLLKYGQPQFIFAPTPALKNDGGTEYNYVRPLATIEPTAIRCGLPVDTAFAYKDTAGLESEIVKPKYQNSVIFIAWEHKALVDFAKELLTAGGKDPTQVPDWKGDDYDTIYLIKITWVGGHESVSFTTDHEGLNNQKDTCP
ncbi:MAG: hypothetical protein ACLQVD_16060 [Capsulimonadaceae bacterium]